MTDALDDLPVKQAAPAGPATTGDGLGELPVQTSALAALGHATSDIDPNQAATVIGLSDKFQTKPEAVAANLPQFQQAAKSASPDVLDDLPTSHPRTAGYLNDPRNMALAQDNIASLQRHEDALGDHGLMGNILMSTGSALNSMVLGASRLPAVVGGQVAGLEHLVNSVIPFGRQMFEPNGAPVVPKSWYHNSVTEFLESNESWYKNASMQQNFLDEVGKGNVGKASGALYSQFVAPMVPLVLASLAGQPELGLGAFGAQVGGEGFVRGKEAGMSDVGASTLGLAKGSVLVAAGKFGETLADIYGAVAAKYGPAMGRQAVAQLAVKASKAMFGSGSTMAAMTAADKIVDYATGLDPHGMDNFSKDVLTSFAGGALVPVAGIPFGVMKARLEERQAEADRSTYTEMAQAAADDKLKARSPEDYANAVATISEGKNIYIPADKFTAYFQEQNLDPKKVAESLGAADSLHEAQQTGGSVEIPLGEWMKAVGTEHETGLRDHVKFSPEGLTVAEVAESKKQAEAQAKTDIDALEKSQGTYHAEAEVEEDGSKKVYDSMREMMKDLRGFSLAEVNNDPKLYQGFYTALGERLGRDPYELSQEYPLTVKRGEAPRMPSDWMVRSAQDQQMAAALGEAGGLTPWTDAALAQGGITPESLAEAMGKNLSAKDIIGLRVGRKLGHTFTKAAELLRKENGGPSESGSAAELLDHLLSEMTAAKNFKDTHGDSLYRRMRGSMFQGEGPEGGEKKIGTEKKPVHESSLQNELRTRGYASDADLQEVLSSNNGRQPSWLTDEMLAELESGDHVENPATFKSVPTSVHSMPITPELRRAALNEGFPMFQGADKPRGSYEPDTRTITLFKSADKSTFLHESGHYFLDVFTAEASKAEAPAELKDDLAALLKWMGADSVAKIEDTHHEKFARGFEAYLREGKAPSTGLRRAFATFKNWLMDTYKKVLSLNVELSPEVGGVMDRMLATKDEIKKAQDAMGYKEFIGEEIDPVLPPALVDKLATMRSRAHDIAEATIMREQLDEMKSSAKAAAEVQRQGLTEQATLEVDSQPVFQALVDLGPKAKKIAGRLLEGKEKAGEREEFAAQAAVWGFQGPNELAAAVMGADRDSAIKSIVASRMTPQLKDGPELQARAMEAVHSSRSDEVMALEREVLFHIAEQAKGKLAEGEAKALTGEQVSNAQKLGGAQARTREGMAVEALQAAFKGWNAEATRSAVVRAKQAAEAARAYAATTLADKPFQQAGLFKRYLAAERQAAKRVGEATAKEDFLGADKAKREQIAAHAMASQAMRNEKVVRRAVDGLREWANRGRDLKGLPFGYVTKIDGLLADFGLAERRAQDPAMNRLAEKMAADGSPAGDVANSTGLVSEKGEWRPETVAELATRMSTEEYKILIPDAVVGKKPGTPTTMRELLSVRNLVSQIAGIGKFNGKILNEYKRGEEVNQIGGRIRSAVQEKFPIRFNAEVGAAKDSVKLLMKAARDLVGIQRIVEVLDRGKDGMFHEYFYRPAEVAQNAEMKMVREMKDQHSEIIGRFYKPEEWAAHHDEVLNLPSFPKGFKFTREQAITWAGYQGISGKADGRIRSAEKSRYMDNPADLKQGTFHLSDAMVNELKGALTKNDWDFVHARWRMMDGFRDQIKENELRTRGVEAAFQGHAQVETPYGTYEGGYQHLTYDYSKALNSYHGEIARNDLYKQYSSASAHTEEGYMKMVSDFQGRPLRFDDHVFGSHLEDLAHDLAFRAPVIDFNQMLRDKNIMASIEHGLGVEGSGFFKDWVNSLGSEHQEPLVAYVQKPIRFLRQTFTFGILGIRASVGPRALATNLENAYQEYGLKNFSAGLADYAMNPGEVTAFNISKSEFMRDQQVYSNRELADLLNKGKSWAGESTLGGKAKNLMQNLAFLPHKLANQKVSQKMFYDLYHAKVGEMGDQKATLFAEEAVKSVFGSGLVMDQAKILRGGDESKRMVTAGYSFFSAMFGRYWERFLTSSLEYREGNTMKAMGILATSLSWMTLFGAGEVAVNHFARNSQRQHDETLGEYALEVAEIPFTMVPFLGSVARYGIQRAIKGHAEFELTGIERVLTRIIDPEIDLIFRQKFDAEKMADAMVLVSRTPLYFKDMAFNFLDWMNGDIEPEWRDLISRRRK